MTIAVICLVIGLLMIGWGLGGLILHEMYPTKRRTERYKERAIAFAIVGLVIAACATAVTAALGS